MSTHQVHVFISHSWSYSGHYDTLADWIFNYPWSSGQASINFQNFSVPKTDPILNANNDQQLRDAIYAQIARSHVIVIPTGMYAIDGAAVYGKPILAVNPWGQQRTSSVVSTAASKTVGWNSKTVVDGIWNLYYR